MDDLLKNIKVCDPACGSGAFLVGMLNMIVNLRLYLQTTPDRELIQQKTEYELKKETIQNCIYGVDIDPGAIEIAKLRLWLSLIVDYELEDIEPLPNLDYRLMCGNSLLEEFEGVKFYNGEESAGQFNFDTEKEEKIANLRKRVKKYFDIHDDNKKQAERKEINSVKDWLVRSALEKRREDLANQRKVEEEKANLLNKKSREKYLSKWSDKFLAEANIEKVLNDLHNPKKEKPFFIWKLEFVDVFEDKQGFDVVIANPPYIDSESMVKNYENIREIIQKSFNWTRGNWDIYIAFFELGFNELNQNGTLAFITPDKWISKPFGDELRKGTIDNIFTILRAGRKVFETAKVDSIISLFAKRRHERLQIEDFVERKVVPIRQVNKNFLSSPFALDHLFSKNLDLLTKISKSKCKLSDFGKCENACSTSDAYKIDSFVLDLKENHFDSERYLKIINTGTIGKYQSKWGQREMTYLKNKYLSPVVDKKEFLKAFNNSYGNKSILPKIIIKGLNLLDGCLDDKGFIVPGKTTLIITDSDTNNLKFLLAVINSKLPLFYIKERYPASSYNQGTTFTKEMINNLPVPKIDDGNKKSIVLIIDKILAITKLEDYPENIEKQDKVKEYERQIDKMVYKLYDLTPEETKIIEEST